MYMYMHISITTCSKCFILFLALSGLSSPRSKASTKRVSTDPAGASIVQSYSVSN